MKKIKYPLFLEALNNRLWELPKPFLTDTLKEEWLFWQEKHLQKEWKTRISWPQILSSLLWRRNFKAIMFYSALTASTLPANTRSWNIQRILSEKMEDWRRASGGCWQNSISILFTSHCRWSFYRISKAAETKSSLALQRKMWLLSIKICLRKAKI